MKSSMRIFLISFLSVVSLIFFSCHGNENQHDHDHNHDEAHGILVEPTNKLVTMRVPQIPCAACKAKVEGVLKTEPGIIRFLVFLESEHSQNVLVVYDPQKITVDNIRILITKLGKTVLQVIEK